MAFKHSARIRNTAVETLLVWAMAALCGWNWLTEAELPSLVTSCTLLRILSLCLICYSFIACFYRGTPGRFLMYAGIFYMYWNEAFIAAQQKIPFSAIGGAMPYQIRFSDEDIRYGLWLISLFQMGFAWAYTYTPHIQPLTQWPSTRIDRFPGKVSLYVFMLLSLSSYLPFLMVVGWDYQNAFEFMLTIRGGRSTNIAFVETLPVPFVVLVILSTLSLGSTGYLFLRGYTTRGTEKLMCVATALLGTLPHLLVGARHLLLYIFLCLFIAFFKEYTPNKAQTLKRIGLIALSSVVLYILFSSQLRYRNVGWKQVSSEEIETSAEMGLHQAATGQFVATLFAIYLVPQYHGFFYEPMTPYFLQHFIPRMLWPSKPFPKSWGFYNTMYTRGQAFNVTPSIVGQYYMNWETWGPLWIGLWMGFLTAMADRILKNIPTPAKQLNSIAALGVFYAFLVCCLRYYSPVYFAYTALAWVVLFPLTKRTKHSTPGAHTFKNQPWPSSNSASTTLPV